jgi:hypothetical protein
MARHRFVRMGITITRPMLAPLTATTALTGLQAEFLSGLDPGSTGSAAGIGAVGNSLGARDSVDPDLDAGSIVAADLGAAADLPDEVASQITADSLVEADLHPVALSAEASMVAVDFTAVADSMVVADTVAVTGN